MPAKGPLPKSPRSSAVTHRPDKPIHFIPPADAPPEPPDSLGPVGQDAWTRWWKSASWLVESDAFGLLIVCQLLDALEEIRLRMAADGRVQDGSKGQPVAHPLHQAQNSLTHLLTSLMNDYGLTPAGRRRLGIEVRAEPAPGRLDRFIRDRGDPYAHLRADDPA
jgi:P27 family predicted phage terminase small subunit